MKVTKTGPWLLKPYEYHTHTFWASPTGIEMLARNRFDKVDDFNYMLTMFVSNDGIHSNMLYKWINPLTFQGNGAYSFRTGISSVRIAVFEFQTFCKLFRYIISKIYMVIAEEFRFARIKRYEKLKAIVMGFGISV